MVPHTYRASHNARVSLPRDSSFLLKSADSSSPPGLFNTQKKTSKEGEKESGRKTERVTRKAFFWNRRTCRSPLLSFLVVSRGVQSGINNLAPRRINKLAPAHIGAKERRRATSPQDEERRCKGKRQRQEDSSGRREGIEGGRRGRERNGGRNCERSSDRVTFLTTVHI